MERSLGEFEQLVLLALLKLADQGHGPALQITLGCAGREVSLGTICKTLHRLERKELVTGRWGRPRLEPGGRRKREYRVSSKGLEALRASLNALRKLYGRTAGRNSSGPEKREGTGAARGRPFDLGI